MNSSDVLQNISFVFQENLKVFLSCSFYVHLLVPSLQLFISFTFFSVCLSFSLPFPISLVLPALVPFIKAEMALWLTHPHNTECLSLHFPQETASDRFTDITPIILFFRARISRCVFFSWRLRYFH